MRRHLLTIGICLSVSCSLEASHDADADLRASAQSVLQNQAFRGLYQTNLQPYTTELTPPDTVNVYVPATDTDSFLRIDPNLTGSGPQIREGFLVVREVLSAGQTSKLTIMLKGPAGYFPAGGDFFYGVTSADGLQWLTDDAGALQVGPVTACGECHAQRAQDGFLFGVPSTFRR